MHLTSLTRLRKIQCLRKRGEDGFQVVSFKTFHLIGGKLNHEINRDGKHLVSVQFHIDGDRSNRFLSHCQEIQHEIEQSSKLIETKVASKTGMFWSQEQQKHVG